MLLLLHPPLSFSLSWQSKLEEYNEQLELKRRDIAKVHEREKALAAAFQASLGEDNKFEEFLTKVFKKRIKRVKKKEQTENEGEQKKLSVIVWSCVSLLCVLYNPNVCSQKRRRTVMKTQMKTMTGMMMMMITKATWRREEFLWMTAFALQVSTVVDEVLKSFT